MKYTDKLKSPKWQKKRLKIMERDGWKCRDTGSSSSELQVHHCWYAPGDPWETPDEFLLTLSVGAHKRRQLAENGIKRKMGKFFANLPPQALERIHQRFGEFFFYGLGSIDPSERFINKTDIDARLANSGAADSDPYHDPLCNLEGDLIWAILMEPEIASRLAEVIDHKWISRKHIEGNILFKILSYAIDEVVDSVQCIYFLVSTNEERAILNQYHTEHKLCCNIEPFINQTIESMARRFSKRRIRNIEKDLFPPPEQEKERSDLILFLKNGQFPKIKKGNKNGQN